MNNPKIVLNHQELKKLLDSFKTNKKRVVFTNGCFDIIHPGHVRYLSAAKKLGDKLVVALNSDSSIKEIKGDSRPIQLEDARLEVMAAFECVDYVTLFSEDAPLSIITLLNPDILVKGGDWKVENIVGADFVKKNGGEVHSIPFTYQASTTEIINKLKKN